MHHNTKANSLSPPKGHQMNLWSPEIINERGKKKKSSDTQIFSLWTFLLKNIGYLTFFALLFKLNHVRSETCLCVMFQMSMNSTRVPIDFLLRSHKPKRLRTTVFIFNKALYSMSFYKIEFLFKILICKVTISVREM